MAHRTTENRPNRSVRIEQDPPTVRRSSEQPDKSSRESSIQSPALEMNPTGGNGRVTSISWYNARAKSSNTTSTTTSHDRLRQPRRPSERMIRKTLNRLQSPTKLDEARRASQTASLRAQEQFLQKQQQQQDWLGSDTTTTYQNAGGVYSSTPNNSDLYSVASNYNDAASVLSLDSTERAFLRGSRRGQLESNEVGLGRGNKDGQQNRGTTTSGLFKQKKAHFDPMQVISENTGKTEANGNNSDDGRKRSKFNKHVDDNVSQQSSKHRKQRHGEEPHAWMCGVCGLAFGSESTCDIHERKHIAMVVAGMGFTDNACVRSVSNDTQEGHLHFATRKESILKPQDKLLSGAFPKSPSSTVENTPKTCNAVAERSGSSAESVHFTFANMYDDEAKVEETNDDGYPGLDADLNDDILVPKPRSRSHSFGVTAAHGEDAGLAAGQHNQPLIDRGSFESQDQDGILLLSNDIKSFAVVADEALLDVVYRAQPLILTDMELHAERELALLARDKAYYDDLAHRAALRRVDPSNRFRSDDEHILGKVQNKLLDAYQLMKEGNSQKGGHDQYNRKKKSGREEVNSISKHSDRTIYVNVMVKNSVSVVRHELERLAKKRWEVTDHEAAKNFTRFERFRAYTQNNMVKLAGIALASDFTPRRIAVQLSNDTYRLMTPRLKRRGVMIESEIEYRVGPYFVLAVNVNTIDWRKLIRSTHRDVVQRKAKWDREHHDDGKGFLRRKLDFLKMLWELTVFDAIAQIFSLLYYFHYFIYMPICWVAYRTVFGSSIRHFILSSVTDEIFYYIEEKGMEMEIRVCRSENQASFMLSALRELRADGEVLKKKRQESESLDKGLVLGPFMGPAIPADKNPAIMPEGFELPSNLENIGLELDLPVGYQRLRWAFLSKKSQFVTEIIYKTEAKYEKIVMGEWDKHADYIGEPNIPDSVDPLDFVGAQKEGEYLMPKSAFVSANMSYETHFIEVYNDYCFCLKKRSKNPDAPFGKTFVAWTQYVVVNTGNNTCKLTCSVEAEFPNGEPMVSRQIRSGMRAGTGELFVLIGETISKYADEFP